MAYYGGVQGVGDGTVLGWVWDPEQPELELDVEVEVNGEIVAIGTADEERDDLIEARVDGAGHGFRIELPDSLRGPGTHQMRVLVGPDHASLPPVKSFWAEGQPERGWEGTRFEIKVEPGETPADVRRWIPLAILASGMLGVAVVLLLISQHMGFFGDEFSFAMKRRDWDADAFLMAHNGHFVLVSATIYKFLFEIVGMSHSWPYRLVLILFHFACVALIYVLAEKRFGRWLALVPAGLLLFPGSSSDDLLWAFQISFVGAMAFGLGALVCLDREDRRFDIAAAVLVFLALASSAVGVAFAIGILAELIVTRRKRHRLFVAIVPFALYGLWYLGFHTSENKLLAENLIELPGYGFRRAGQGFAGFANLPLLLGKLMLIATVIWLVARAWTSRYLPARALVGIVGGLAFWGLTGLARAQIVDPIATRYIYPSMVFILIAVIPCVPRIRTVRRQVAVVLAAFLGFAMINNYSPVKSYADWRVREDSLLATDYSAEVIADRPGDPWVATVRELDFPLFSAAQITKLPAEYQLRADTLLVRADQARFDIPTEAEIESGRPAKIPELHNAEIRGRTKNHPGCTRVAPTGPGPILAMPVPTGQELLILRAGKRNPKVTVRVRRLSPEFQRTFLSVPEDALAKPGSAGIIRILPDPNGRPWYARLEYSDAIGLCLVRSPS